MTASYRNAIQFFAVLSLVIGLIFAGPAETEESVFQSQCESFAGTIQETVAKGDPSFFNRNLDIRGLVEKSTLGIEATQATKREFLRGFMETFDFGAELVRQIREGGSYKLLRVHRFDGSICAQFRLITTEGGVNYHELQLERDLENQLRIRDFYNYASGEWISRGMRRSFLPLVAERDKGLITKLLGWEADYTRNTSEVLLIGRLHQSSKSEQALQVWRGLPASLKEDKNLLIIRIAAAAKTSAQEYIEAVGDYERLYPGDPALDLLLIDSDFLRGDFGKLLKRLDRLDGRVGGDPYLDVLRCKVSLARGKPITAKEQASRAISREPTLVEAHWALVSISLMEKEFQDTTRLLTILERDFGRGIDDLENAPEYAEFIQSLEYRHWKDSRKKN